MSAFEPKTPEPGWQTRWPKEAAKLVFASGPIIVAYLVIMAGVAYLSILPSSHVLSSLLMIILVVLAGGPTTVWFLHYIGRQDVGDMGFSPRYLDLIKVTAISAIGFMIPLMMISILFDTAGSGEGFKIDIWNRTSTIMLFSYMILHQTLFTPLSRAMTSEGDAEITIISEKAQARLNSVFPKSQGRLMIFWVLMSVFLPGPALCAMNLFFLFLLYVAGREIIGGITGTKEESYVEAPA